MKHATCHTYAMPHASADCPFDIASTKESMEKPVRNRIDLGGGKLGEDVGWGAKSHPILALACLNVEDFQSIVAQ